MAANGLSYFIGVDEAGYGPNLGPLVVSATMWTVPGDARRVDLYRLLRAAITCDVQDDSDRWVIADSKRLYSTAAGLARLERELLTALALLDFPIADWHSLWGCLEGDGAARVASLPWHMEYRLPLPVACELESVAARLPAIRAALEKAGVRLAAMASCTLFPREFNQATQRSGNKAQALSHATLMLVRSLLSQTGDAPVFVLCDKHGGRNYYAGLVQELLADGLVQVVRESRAESRYRFQCQYKPEAQASEQYKHEAQASEQFKPEVEICFRAEGESCLPTALASMTSKYLRELSMRAFNDFWQARLPGLRPTAGYPLDARRFKQDIAAVQAELGIADELLWRSC